MERGKNECKNFFAKHPPKNSNDDYILYIYIQYIYICI